MTRAADSITPPKSPGNKLATRLPQSPRRSTARQVSGVGKSLERSPLPAPLREVVIDALVELLLAEIERDPDAYRAGPDGGPTVTPPPVNASAQIVVSPPR
jgi:hypothetical protein